MSSFPTLNLVAWISFVYIATSISDIVRRELTKDQVELHSNSEGHFPNILIVLLKNTSRTVTLTFAKKEINYDLPVYTRAKDEKEIVIIDTPPIKNAAFYEDQTHDASVTLHCEEKAASSHLPNSCQVRSMSGFFYLDGYTHVIEPKKRMSKRYIIDNNTDSSEEFGHRHQVFKIHMQNHRCNIKYDMKSFKNFFVENVTKNGNERIKRAKMKNTIEIMALFTHTMPINLEEMKRQKIYYIHVFWGVNKIYNNINVKDMTFALNLTGLILEPHDTPLYVFPKGDKNYGYLIEKATINAVADFKVNYPCDHLTMFSIYRIGEKSDVVGMAPIRGMCAHCSVSLIRDIGNFQEIFIIAHELGHSLNSFHDGEGNNPCSARAGYIMAAMIDSKPSTHTVLNRYTFSACTIWFMANFVRHLNPNCLLTQSKSALAPTIPTGQLYTLGDQCRARSYLKSTCPDPIIRKSRELCASIWCYTGKHTCRALLPAYKTTCGNKKWCIFGKCVYDVNAPQAEEDCLYGDTEKPGIRTIFPNGTIYIPKDCTELTRMYPDICHHSRHKHTCCYSCFNLTHPEKKIPATPLVTIGPSTTVSGSDASVHSNRQIYPVALAVLLYLFKLGCYFLI